MKLMHAAVFLLLGLKLANVANAADKNDNFSIMGYGANSCATFTEARRHPTDLEANLYVTWLTGYLTGVNFSVDRTYSIAGATRMNGLLEWVDNYCASNPTKDFSHAVIMLVDFLYPNRIQQAPK